MIPVFVVLLVSIAAGRIPPGQTQTREPAPIATASIRGHVTRDDGRPAARAVVLLLNDDADASSVAATTDETGAYRFTALRPGRYRISATKVGYATLEFNQRRPFERGEAIFLDPGERRDRVDIVRKNVDFALAMIGTARITGTTVTSTGESFQGGIQMRPSRRSGAIAGEEVGARTLADGSFEFPNVPPGEYVLYAFRNVETAWRYVTVTGADVTGLAIQTMPGSTIAGRLTFEGPDVPAPTDVELTPVPADPDLAPFVGGSDRADIHDDWTFEITNVNGPRRLRVLRPPPGWSLKAILVNGTDVTDAVMSFGTRAESLSDVEVVLTRQQTQVSGRVTDERGRPDAGSAVVAFAIDDDKRGEDSRFFAVTRAARDGAFEIRGLPSGDYFIAAADRGLSDDEWHDPEVLNALARTATRVALNDGQAVAVILKKP